MKPATAARAATSPAATLETGSVAARAAARVDALIDPGVKRRFHTIVTPEGIQLPVALADHSERLIAFVLDLVFWLGATLAIYLAAFMIIGRVRGALILYTLVTLIAFVVRNLYFIYFEIAWGGATPGKKILKLRVVDRNGGPLVPTAIIARNLTRELEVFMPIGVFFSLQAQGRTAGDWQSFALFLWLCLLSGLPLFNRLRLRGGDMIAGTLLVSVPKRALLDDFAADAAAAPSRILPARGGEVHGPAATPVEAPAAAAPAYAFTARQLSAYGAFELQVLEQLLRRAPSADTTRVKGEVAAKIAAKIGWTEAIAPDRTDAFLRAFYAAERAHLEREQAFGRIVEDKHGRGQGPAAR